MLANELQGNRPFHKWSQRSKAGVYLGRSPQHGRNVALVMDRDTALVSPQFHVAFDATFDTVKTIKTKSSWQLRAGFVTTQKEPMGKEIKSPHKQTASMTSSSNKKRKRHTSDKIGTAGDPVPSKKKEPAAANVGDDGPPIPFNTTKTGDSVIGSATEPIRTRFGRTVKPVQRILAAMCTEISEATRGDVEGEIYCFVAMFPNDNRWSYRNPLIGIQGSVRPGRTILLPGNERERQGRSSRRAWHEGGDRPIQQW